MPVDLSAAEVATLYRRVEGWVAGLQLAALFTARPGRCPGQSARSPTARVTCSTTCWMRCSTGSRPMCSSSSCRTAILERLTAALCDAVTGRNDSARMLPALEHANLFIAPLDAAGEWYRYHPLFADLLRHRLDLDAVDVAASVATDAGALQRPAAGGTLNNVSFPTTIGHALSGCDWTLAAELIDQASGPLLGTETDHVHQLVQDAPAGDRAHPIPPVPRLCLAVAAGRPDRRRGRVAGTCGKPCAGRGPASDGNLRWFQGQIAAARSYLARARGNIRRSAEMAQQALTLLPETEAVGS